MRFSSVDNWQVGLFVILRYMRNVMHCFLAQIKVVWWQFANLVRLRSRIVFSKSSTKRGRRVCAVLLGDRIETIWARWTSAFSEMFIRSVANEKYPIVQYCLAFPKMTCNDTNRANCIKCHHWPMLYPIKERCSFSVIGRNLNRPEKNRSCVKSGSREGDVELWQLTSTCMTIMLHKERMIDVLI